MIYLYECEECKTQQEKHHKMNDSLEEPCEKCGAKPEKLKKLINWQPTHGRHISWSKWQV